MREGDRLGKYTLERLLARGGMGQVFRARYAGAGGFSKRCVLKCLLPRQAQDASFVGMFMDEARAAANLSHPGVVQVFDFGCEDDIHFLVMEYLRGVDLRAILGQARRAREPIPTDVVLWIAHEACEGLQYVHTVKDDAGHPLNLVHRDVSLSNVMITDQGAVKLLDFGIAKSDANQSQTEAGAIKGKFDYLSPEQAEGKPIDGRSDLFSLGIVMYELLLGRRLFHRDNLAASLTAVLNAPIERPSKLRRELTSQVDDVVMKALARDPDARFASAAEMRLSVQALLSESPAAGRERLASYVQTRFADVLAEADLPLPQEVDADASRTVTGATSATAAAGEGSPEGARDSTAARTGTDAHDPAAMRPPTDARDTVATHPPTDGPGAGGPKRRVGRWLLGGGLLVAVAAGGWFLWSQQQQEHPWWSFEAWQTTQEDVLAGAEPVELTPEPEAAAAPATTQRAPRRQTGTKRSGTKRSGTEQSGTKQGEAEAELRGELLVICPKACEVFVDGRAMRPDDPTAPLSLPAGQRALRVVDADSGREHTTPVLIAPNRVHVEEVSFPPTFMERDGMEEW